MIYRFIPHIDEKLPSFIIVVSHIVLPCRFAEVAVFGFAVCYRLVFKPNASFFVETVK